MKSETLDKLSAIYHDLEDAKSWGDVQRAQAQLLKVIDENS